MPIHAAGLGNAIMDALVRLDDDDVLAELGLTRGQMHPVDHDRWEAVHQRVASLGVEVHSGGSCANTMQTMALLGADVLYCGQIGDDAQGRAYASAMTAHTSANMSPPDMIDSPLLSNSLRAPACSRGARLKSPGF